MVALQILFLAGALGAEGQTTLLNFTQANCPPCKAMEPVLGQLEAAGMPIQSIDVTQHPEIAQRFNVGGTPTFVLLVNGREANRVVGFTTAEKLQAMFPIGNAPPVGDVRGQSPDAKSSYLGERMGAMLGRGSATDDKPTGVDPFAARQAQTPAPRNELIPVSDEETKAVPAIHHGGMDPQSRAVAAAVRLKVEDAKGHSLGSGTIIDMHQNEAVLITCGHIFRDSQGKGRITVDLFYPTQRTVEGKLLDYDLQRDIALVTIPADSGVVAAPVATQATTVNKSDAAFSIGCDRGQDPSVRQTKISGLNRYQGPPNIEARGAPVDGRSGGGLFSQEGRLIGVCNAADPADDEGIYAAMATIHWQLDKVNLSEVYQDTGAAQVVEEAPRGDSSRALAEVGRDLPDLNDRAAVPNRAIPASSAGDTEIICIVRSKANPSAKGQVIVIDRATPELLAQIAAGSSDPTVAADLALSADRRAALSPPTGPVVRGQSRR